jgi:uncharacterized integral membrane protein
MRLILILSILLVVVAGAWFGALNATSVELDFHFFRLQTPVGFALLACVLVGWLLGGFAAVAGPLPRLRRELRRLRRELHEARASQPARTDRA